MNIEDFTPILYDFNVVFDKQKQLKFLFEPSSKQVFENFDIDVYEDQEIFKRYCWRITEELMESLEDKHNINHFKEEVIDGFNFLIELYLLYGWGFENLPIPCVTFQGTIEDKILNIIYQLGVTANCLKNRQWRKSQYLVDLYIFEPRLKEIWSAYWGLFLTMGLTTEDVLKLWSLKYQVNLFRIKSNY